jgi:uncharacterized protein YndB with AHSA1/START domain
MRWAVACVCLAMMVPTIVRAQGAGDESEGAMRQLRTLADGEWVCEKEGADGAVFRARLVMRPVMDGRFVVADGWLGDASGMRPHAHFIAGDDPATGRAFFVNLGERGDVARGEVRLVHEVTLALDWGMDSPGRARENWIIEMTAEGPDLLRELAWTSGEARARGDAPALDLTYRRVAAAPARFTRLKGEPRSSAGEPLIAEGIVNAPVSEVWRVFTTGEGYTRLGVAKADVDLRPGGLIRSHYNPAGVLGDEGTIVTEILAYEPQRSLATRIKSPPRGFPFKEAYTRVWTVISMADLGDGRTSVRVSMQGYGDDEESMKMREFFRTGNEWVIRKLQSGYDASVKPGAPAHAEGPLAPIEIVQVVNAPREGVWKAYATSEGWAAFIGVETRIGDKPGDPFEVLFGKEAPAGQRGSEGCTILSIVPGEMLSYSWNAPAKFAHARAERTWVVATFEPLGASTTRVRLRHFGFAEQASAHPDHREEWAQVRAYFAGAWPRVTGALAEHFAPRKASQSSTGPG